MTQKSKAEEGEKLFDSAWPGDIEPQFGLPVAVRGGASGKAKAISFGFLENPTLVPDVWRVRVWKTGKGGSSSFLASLDNMRPRYKESDGTLGGKQMPK